jgi:hypothetical protein
MLDENKSIVRRWTEARNTNNVEAAVALFLKIGTTVCEALSTRLPMPFST